MYINRNKHILSRTIMFIAICKLVEAALVAMFRFWARSAVSFQPDMLNDSLNRGQTLLSVIHILLSMGAFYLAWQELLSYRKAIPSNDYVELAKLQEETFGRRNSSLSSYSINQLLQVWAAILVGIDIVYEITSDVYRKFMTTLSGIAMTQDESIAAAFLTVYNSSHGFKYLGMFLAIILGVFITGVFLQDKYLKLCAIVSMGIFLVAFVILQMNTFVIFSKMVGIVWTSVIFHLVETVGLIALALYLRKHYNGL